MAAAERSLVWSDEFLIGIDELDYEHRCLIDDINLLHRELLEHVEADCIRDTLGSIHARMHAHFALEEHVMLANKYPHYREHKAEHDQLLDDYTELMTGFEKDPDLADREAIERILRRWIVDHIVTSDKKMSLMVASAPRTRRAR